MGSFCSPLRELFLLGALGVLGGQFTLAQTATRPVDEDDDVASTQPAEIRRGMAMGGAREQRQQRFFEELARKIEPSTVGDPQKLDVYLDFFRREVVRDRRLFAFEVEATVPDQGDVPRLVVVLGEAEHPQQLDAFVRLLEALHFRPAPAAETMPHASLGGKHFGIVRAQRSFLRAKDEARAETVNEAVAGEPVWLLKAGVGGERLLCHAVDGYVGWINAVDVARVDAERFVSAMNSRPPTNAEKIEAAIAEARRRLGKPYVWGGRSDDGVDCSGLVQQSFASQGVHLPRDAEQQALVGRLVATRWHRDAMRRGDLMFFMGRRGTITHTAIYLGDGEMIESADGGVKVSPFREGTPRWQSFCFAKRVLD
jgi:cell wall-associated NlpC family hydrolase